MSNKYVTVNEVAAAAGFTTQYIYKVLNKLKTDEPTTYKRVLKSDKGKKLINMAVLFEYMGIDMPTEEKTVKTEINASNDNDIVIEVLNKRIEDLQNRIAALEEDKKNLKAMYDALNERYNYEQQLQLKRMSLPEPEEVEVLQEQPKTDREEKKPASGGNWFSRFRR